MLKTNSWPIEVLPFEELLAPIIESFLDPEEGRAFDWSRSAIRQLYDRVDELAPKEEKEALLTLIRDQLGEFDCLAICCSGTCGSSSSSLQKLDASAAAHPISRSSIV